MMWLIMTGFCLKLIFAYGNSGGCAGDWPLSGAQLLALALGACVYKAEIPEIGWVELQASTAGVAGEWFGDRQACGVSVAQRYLCPA
jgi:hypothetical protein